MARNVIDRDSLIGMVASPLVWAAHFLVCYTVVALACAFGFGTEADGEWGTVRTVLVIVSAGAVLIITGLTFLAFRRWRQSGGSEPPHDNRQERHQFMSVAGLLLSVLSGIGVVYTAIPLLVLPIC